MDILIILNWYVFFFFLEKNSEKNRKRVPANLYGLAFAALWQIWILYIQTILI